MAREVSYCDACGTRVLGEGPAAAILDRTYCRACRVDPPAPPRGRETSRTRRNPLEGGVYAVPVAAGSRPPVRAPRPSRRPGTVAALFLGAGGLGAILLVWNPGGMRTGSPLRAELSVTPVPRRAPRPEPAPPPPAPATAPVGLPEPKPAPLPDSRAQELHDEITEACGVLADEGRFDDAIRLIETFPAELRASAAWRSLEGLRRQVEQLRASGLPRRVPR